MTDTDPTLSDDERDAFLGDGGTGVLSFSTGEAEPPHATPVSYGYDEVESDFYFRLAVDDDSAKRAPTDRLVTFVVHGQSDDEWQSVVAAGRTGVTRVETPTELECQSSAGTAASPWSTSVPRRSRNAEIHSGWSGHACPVTRLPSVTTPSTHEQPAASTSAWRAG